MDALKRASADRITAVIPYYGYARQDRKTKARDPITAKLVADLISTAGADRILVMDLHAAQIQGYFDIPVDHLLGAPILAEYFIGKDMKDAVVVSPDVGSVSRARYFADRMDLPIAIVDKRRPKANVAEVVNVIGDIRGKDVIFIDDIVDTAGSITAAAKAMQSLGAKRYSPAVPTVSRGLPLRGLRIGNRRDGDTEHHTPRQGKGLRQDNSPFGGPHFCRSHNEDL